MDLKKDAFDIMDELLAKGREALSVGEWQKAKELLEGALKIEKSPEAYEALSWACWWLNDAAGIFENRTIAYDLYLEKEDRLGASRIANWIGLDSIEFKGEFAVASGWFKRAESLLDGLPDSPELGMVKIVKARWAFQAEKNIELALKLIDEGLALSKSLKNVNGEMLSEALKGFILVAIGKISEGMPLLDEATLLATTAKTSHINITTLTCCFLIDACERTRDYERASQWCNNVKELCKRWKYKAMFANCRMKHAGILIWKGDWKEAEEGLRNATHELKVFRPVQLDACAVRMADLKRRQGKWDEAEALFNRVGPHPLKNLYMAYLCYDKEEYETALNLAERYLRPIPVEEKAERTTGVELLSRIYAKVGKHEEAQAMLGELKEIVDAIDTPPLKAAYQNACGEVDYALKNYEMSRQRLEGAIDIYDEVIAPFESGRARLVLVEALLKMGQFAQAEMELNTAMKLFKGLGADKDFERAQRLSKNLNKGTAEQFVHNEFEFTGRELEVLKSLVDGKNNDEIAESLFLSVRTVEKHLTNIYSKMGISGKSARAYAASYAVKHDLVF